MGAQIHSPQLHAAARVSEGSRGNRSCVWRRKFRGHLSWLWCLRRSRPLPDPPGPPAPRSPIVRRCSLPFCFPFAAHTTDPHYSNTMIAFFHQQYVPTDNNRLLLRRVSQNYKDDIKIRRKQDNIPQSKNNNKMAANFC